MSPVHSGARRDASLPRFLVVEAHASRRFESWLEPFLELGCPLERAPAGAELALEPPPDLVLYDLACGLEGIGVVRARFPAALVMAVAAPGQGARRALAAGAHEWLELPEGAELDRERAFDAIERLLLLGPRPALPRRRRKSGVSAPAELLATREEAVPPPLQMPGWSPALPGEEPARAAAEGALVVRVLEVAEDGGPVSRPAPVIEGQELAGETLALELACVEPRAGERLLAAVERDGAPRWACFVIEHVAALAAGRHALRCRAAQGAHDLLAPGALLPAFDVHTMRYKGPALGPRARAWVELGVLREVELDRVLVCPRCQALPTFRLGCRRCGGGGMDGQRLVHHFPCAHVGPLSDYQSGGVLVCPKCAARPLIVNSDFEYLEGPMVCGQCGARDGQGELVGHCFVCALRFLSRVAATLVLRGFDVDRLVPLDRGVPA